MWFSKQGGQLICIVNMMVFFVIVLETLQILGYITEKQVRLTCKLRDQNLLFSPSTVSIKKAENIL